MLCVQEMYLIFAQQLAYVDNVYQAKTEMSLTSQAGYNQTTWDCDQCESFNTKAMCPILLSLV